MSLLEYFPIGLAVAGLALRYVLSKPSAQAVQAWEASRTGRDTAGSPARLAVAARTSRFAAA
jgi:hypothetical protein